MSFADDKPRLVNEEEDMSVIWKYNLAVTDYQTVTMPEGARLLSIGVQHNNDYPCMWALVEPDRPVVEFGVCILGTGHNVDLSSGWEFVGMFQLRGGLFVGHVFVRESIVPAQESTWENEEAKEAYAKSLVRAGIVGA